MHGQPAFNDNQIEALIHLIDDPDEHIYGEVKHQIVSLGESIIPRLEAYWEQDTFGNLFQVRIEDIIHEIQFSSVQLALKSWNEQGGEDLLDGALILSRYHYPEMEAEEVRNQISKIRQDIWLELNDNLTAFEQVKVFNQVLFDMHGFRGNKNNYHAPQNSYINQVVDTKRGNPLSLSMLYIILAQSLDIPVHGVNLPHHFVLAYEDRFQIFSDPNEDPDAPNVLFYINPFSRGTLLDRAEIDRFLKHVNLKPEPRFFAPCDNRVMILRTIHNLMFSYQKTGETDKIKELKVLAAIFE